MGEVPTEKRLRDVIIISPNVAQNQRVRIGHQHLARGKPLTYPTRPSRTNGVFTQQNRVKSADVSRVWITMTKENNWSQTAKNRG